MNSKRKLTSDKCDLFEYYKSLNSVNNDDILKLYMNDLNKVYNSSFNENQLIDLLNENEKETFDISEDKFKICKEKALNFLLKAEQLNTFLETSYKNDSDLITDEDIQTIVDEHQTKKQNDLNYLINLYKLYEINLGTELQKSNAKLDEILGLDEYKLYLSKTLNRLIGNSLSSNHLTNELNDNSIQNAIIYGMPGSGKMSLLTSFLIDKKILRFTQTDSCISLIKVLIIDFEQIASKISSIEICLIENLLKSINLLIDKKRINILVVIKNLELVFKLDIFEKHRSRFIGDLLHELSNSYSERPIDLESMNQNRCVFIVLSESPWDLPTALVYQFKTKIHCPDLSDIELNKLLKIYAKKILKTLGQDWIFKTQLEIYFKKFNILQNVHEHCLMYKLTGRLVFELVSKIQGCLIEETSRVVKEKLSEYEISNEDYEIFKNANQGLSNYKTSLKNVKYWKSTKIKLSIISRFNNRKPSSFNRKLSQDASTTETTSPFEAIKAEVWISHEKNNLKETLIQVLKTFLSENKIEIVVSQKYGNFISKYKF